VTLSLGGGISYQDLALSRNATDLVLDAGNEQSITLKDWYAEGMARTAINLQLIAEAMASFDASSADPLLNAKVQTFDFDMLVGQFDAAWAANNAVDHWRVMDSLLQAHLASSNDGALGGDLAYQYGINGDLGNVRHDRRAQRTRGQPVRCRHPGLPESVGPAGRGGEAWLRRS